MSPASLQTIPRQIGRYRVTAQLGAGGLGKVFQGEDEAGNQVAIKVLTNVSDRSLARFRRELELGRTLDHPHLVRTLDGGTIQDHPFLVLELVPGEDLSQRLRRGGPLPAPELLDLARQLADGLSYLHGRGLVHRDLKPENLRVRPDGHLKILDLGLMHAPDTTAITATGTVLGTFLYMSPEQLRGGEKSPSMDLYSTAVLLYKLSTGRHPLYGEGSIKLSDYLPLPALGEVLPWRPGQTTALDAFFRRALAPAPAGRWETPEELVRSFASALAAEGLVESDDAATGEDTLPIRISASSAGSVSSAILAPRPPPTPVSHGRRGAMAFGLVGLLGAATWWAMPAALPKVQVEEGLALSPDHLVLVVRTDREATLRLGPEGPEVPRDEPGRRHFVPVARDQDDLRLYTESGAPLPPRSLSGRRWEPLTWGVDGSLTWGGAELPLPRPDQGGPWARPLPRPEEMLAELTRGILELDVPRWIFEAQETGRRPGRLGDLLVERGLATLQANTAALLEARLESVPALPIEDVELWYLAHDLCLAEAYLRRNRATLPIDPLARGLHGRLIQAADYTRDGRPPARPGRQVHEKNQDFFLPDLPGRETRDAVEELWYRAKEPASLAVPPGSRPAHFEAVLTWATRFALEYYALVTIEGMRPVYFYEDPTGPGGQVSREAATKQGGQLRRRYWLLVPEALLPDGPLSLEVTFRPWSWDEEQGYEHVIMQAYGWTRDAAPGGR